MLIHAISKPIPNKVLWILIIFFLNLLGAIIYYFVIRKNFNPVGNPSINNLINPVYMAPVAPAPVAPAALNSMTPPPVQ